MSKKITLSIDAFINLILGILLLAYSPPIVKLLGVPSAEDYFYPNILGAIFIGITIALLIEAFRKKPDGFIGLGLIGAICINMCGGIVLFLWLVFGDLNIPLKGYIFLWILDIILLIISSIELIINISHKKLSK
ncbi:MAG: hypothetical protein P8Y99_09330 [Calditrichaceae bacterium]